MKTKGYPLLATLLLATVLLCGCAGQGSASPAAAELLGRVTLELRTGTRWGGFDETLGQLGGVPLLNDAGQSCGGFVLLEQSAAILDETGAFCGVSPWEEGIELRELSPIPAPGAVPALRALCAGTNGTQWHYAFYLPDPEGPVYALWLDAEVFDADTFEKFALSANFAAE